QYTAAALVSENKVLAHPASVDSIPTSANQEDHVSMGSVSARHARMVLGHVEAILAIELLVAAEARDLRVGPLDGAAPRAGVGALVRRGLPHLCAAEMADAATATVAGHQRIGIGARTVTASEVAVLVPGAVVVGIGVGAFEPQSGYADPSGTAAGFLEAA